MARIGTFVREVLLTRDLATILHRLRKSEIRQYTKIILW